MNIPKEEIMFTVGVAMFLIGLWNALGIGWMLIFFGAVLVTVALFHDAS